MSRTTRFLRLSWPDRLLLVEAMAWLCWAKLLLRVAPFRWISPRLGRCMTESPAVVDDSERRVASRVRWAVHAAVRHAPIEFVCLPQAMTAKWMLRRRRLPSTLYLGVRREENASVGAHAWLRVGDQILTGRAQRVGHQTVATFSDVTLR